MIVPKVARRVAAAIALLVLVGIQFEGRARDLPQTRRQVPQQQVFRHPIRGPFVFGAKLGTGAFTYITTVGPYLGAAIAVGIGPAAALLFGLAFGSARGLTPRILGSSGAQKLRSQPSTPKIVALAAATLTAVSLLAAS